jgi:hypothetical protein
MNENNKRKLNKFKAFYESENDLMKIVEQIKF